MVIFYCFLYNLKNINKYDIKRSGATNREISGEELHKILNKQKNVSWCDVGVVSAKITDIDSESIRIFKEQAIASGRMKSIDLKCSNKL